MGEAFDHTDFVPLHCLAFVMAAMAQAISALGSCPLEDRTSAWMLAQVKTSAASMLPEVSEVDRQTIQAALDLLVDAYLKLENDSYDPPIP
ncbi:MAG: hypothetical protein OXQ31_26565 [Spirochaetaceae bacterium]|nr:hypothetical protein [Spirochaetaceae bacterium]